MFFKKKESTTIQQQLPLQSPFNQTVKKSKSAKDLFHKLTTKTSNSSISSPKLKINSPNNLISSPVLQSNKQIQTNIPTTPELQINQELITPLPHIHNNFQYPHELYYESQRSIKAPSIPPPPIPKFSTPISEFENCHDEDNDILKESPRRRNIRSTLIKSGDFEFINDTESFMNGILSTSTSRQESPRESSISLTEAQIQIFQKYNNAKTIRLVENILSDYEGEEEREKSEVEEKKSESENDEFDIQKLEMMLMNEKNSYLLKRQQREINHLNKLLSYQQGIITKLSKDHPNAKNQKLLPPFKFEILVKNDVDSLISSDESSIMSTPGNIDESRKISSSSSSIVQRNYIK
ncbi:unnamed protein product [Candida verbasci]|uniref:Uncharacterized protein n=1 Tax=Candida verbasci TaxID=1227364 RepID=A0A9W4TZ85_9ASCO|nr:unnamed protein product [Candida verbasci]